MVVKELDTGIKQSLNDKRDLFVFLCNDFIDIEELNRRGLKMISDRNSLEEKLHRIYQLNPDSRKCSELSHLFIEFFDVRMRKLDEFMGKVTIEFPRGTDKAIGALRRLSLSQIEFPRGERARARK